MSDKEAEGVPEEADVTGDWGKIPYIALALIFSYLPDRDKFNASLVNRYSFQPIDIFIIDRKINRKIYRKYNIMDSQSGIFL